MKMAISYIACDCTRNRRALFATQSLPDKPASPKQVVERYFRFEADGGRLTPEGWQKADVFWSPVRGSDCFSNSSGDRYPSAECRRHRL
jgi:hypothetical protein